MPDVCIRPYTPPDAAWIARIHGWLYTRDDGFDGTFQPLVEQILNDFDATHNARRERGWIAERGGDPLGCIFCTKHDQSTAKVRLFLILPEERGKSLGRDILAVAMRFARDSGYLKMKIWTHESHRAACALYQRTGFDLVTSSAVRSFGCDLIEQCWEIDL